MRRSHTVPAESQWSSESCMPVLLTSRADAICWMGDKISTSASECHRSARRRSSSPAAGRTSESLGIGGSRFERLRSLEFILAKRRVRVRFRGKRLAEAAGSLHPPPQPENRGQAHHAVDDGRGQSAQLYNPIHYEISVMQIRRQEGVGLDAGLKELFKRNLVIGGVTYSVSVPARPTAVRKGPGKQPRPGTTPP